MENIFRKLAATTANLVGSSRSFFIALIIIITWGVAGPSFQFSDTWQLVINTGTTIITFLIVFLIQNTQNRDSRAMQLKLDELLHAVKGARSSLINIEELTDQELEILHNEFREIHDKCVEALAKRQAKKTKTLST